ncbi:MAG: PaaI family thioesterase [Pseudomonadota bacterium]
MTTELNKKSNKLPVLEYLQKSLAGTLNHGDCTHMQYPTPISQTLGIRIVEVAAGTATVAIDASPELHGNQQATIHGGLLCELADAAIGTAHSTLMEEGESFASIDLKINFFRPVWTSTLRATATPLQSGRTITHYKVDIVRDDGKLAATVISTVMTLRGDKAQGR